jgi:hypothetical protein
MHTLERLKAFADWSFGGDRGDYSAYTYNISGWQGTWLLKKKQTVCGLCETPLAFPSQPLWVTGRREWCYCFGCGVAVCQACVVGNCCCACVEED